ncbi:MAG: D-alanyl-D-alanine carboxypeptidase/D-alanyl-D-alanine-endopeptidase [Bacteroidales bacterium]|nr:D-alanyl-D-alanine carboxypeptidase/D-alanyl-D-alanine-endopeptidase [Bacteroidales bacterium]
MKRNRLKLLVAAALLCPTIVEAQSTKGIEQAVGKVEREEGMEHGVLAVSVYNVETNKAIYEHNAGLSLTTASVSKLFTTGAGFAQLGGDFRFTTRVVMHGTVDREGVLHGDVYLIGGGDPMLGSYRYRQTHPDTLFAALTRALKGKGIRRIYGRIFYDASTFDSKPLHDSWQWGDIGNYYASGVSGLNFHENMYFVYFNPASHEGLAAAVARTQPKNLEIYATNQVSTGEEGTGDGVVVYGSPFSAERRYTGTVPLGKAEFAIRAAMPTPAKNFADLFSTYLRTHGISVSATSAEATVEPDSLQQVLDYRSSPYATIAQYTNHTSNNLYAECIFKYLGYKVFGEGSFENGEKVVVQYLKGMGLSTKGTRVVDGSGLSRLDHTTADFLCRYLSALNREPYYDKFLLTLPKAGESGTARRLLPSLPKGVSVYVKTGTMEGVKAYAGYVQTAGGETYAFSIISNGHECTSRVVAEKLERILQQIALLHT